MPDNTPNEIVNIIYILGECHGNYSGAARLYRNRFPDRQYPNTARIRRLVSKTTSTKIMKVFVWHQSVVTKCC